MDKIAGYSNWNSHDHSTYYLNPPIYPLYIGITFISTWNLPIVMWLSIIKIRSTLLYFTILHLRYGTTCSMVQEGRTSGGYYSTPNMSIGRDDWRDGVEVEVTLSTDLGPVYQPGVNNEAMEYENMLLMVSQTWGNLKMQISSFNQIVVIPGTR